MSKDTSDGNSPPEQAPDTGQAPSGSSTPPGPDIAPEPGPEIAPGVVRHSVGPASVRAIQVQEQVPVHYRPPRLEQPGTVGATTGLLALREHDPPAGGRKAYATGLAAAERARTQAERERRRNLPRDVKIVLFNADLHNSRHLAELHIAAWRHAYRGVMPDDVLRSLHARQFEDRWDDLLSHQQGDVFTLLAVTGAGRLAGFVRGGQASGKGAPAPFEIFALNVHPRCQQRGIGWLLCCEAMVCLRELGAGPVASWVLDGNRRARWFFKRCGADVVEIGQDVAGNAVLPKTAYGWPHPGVVLPGGFVSRIEEGTWRTYIEPGGDPV